MGNRDTSDQSVLQVQLLHQVSSADLFMIPSTVPVCTVMKKDKNGLLFIEKE